MPLFKTTQGKHWAFTVVFAFISVIFFFQMNSYWADKANLNWLCTTIGVVFALLAIFFVVKVAGGGGSQE